MLQTLSKTAKAMGLLFGILGFASLIIAMNRPTEPMAVAVVNSERIVATSAKLRQMMDEASLGAESTRAEYDRMRADYEARAETYEAQKLLITSEEAAKRFKELSDLGNKLQLQELQLNLLAKNTEDQILAAMYLAIQQTARERDLKVILPIDSTTYHAPEADLTDAIIALLDRQ